jgi:hypothetical protein
VAAVCVAVLTVVLGAIGAVSNHGSAGPSIVIPQFTVPNLNFGGAGTVTTGPGAATGGAPTPSSAGGKANGVQPPAPGTYLTAAGVRAGLRAIERLAPHATLSSVRIDSDSISAYVHLPNGRFRLAGIQPTGPFTTSGTSRDERYFPADLVHPAAVPRILRGMQRRFGVVPARVDYLVFSWIKGLAPEWLLFTRAPSHPGYSATPSGGDLRKLG